MSENVKRTDRNVCPTKTMSTELDQAREIAERVARRVAGDSHSKPNRAYAKPEVNAELAAVRAGIGELQKKLAQLEAKVSLESPQSPSSSGSAKSAAQVPSTHSPWLAGVNAS